MQFISYHEFSKVMKSCHNSTLSTDSLPTFTDSVMNSTDSLLICTDLLLNSTDSLLTSTSKTLVKLSTGSPHTSTDSYWLSTTSIDSLLTSSDCTDHYCNYHAAHKTGQAQNCIKYECEQYGHNPMQSVAEQWAQMEHERSHKYLLSKHQCVGIRYKCENTWLDSVG